MPQQRFVLSIDIHEPGEVIGQKYRLVEVAGRGGMATVWRAQLDGARGFCRPVAVKQMHPHLAEQPAYVDMFVEEARVGADLKSPNIASIYDFVEQDGNFYLVMEWVEGVDLGAYIHYVNASGSKTPWELAVAVGIGVTRALIAAHERVLEDGEAAPVVHRDISPHNVLLTGGGMVKLIDFGLSLATDRRSELTEPGVVKGKMSYLSPEIVAGGRPSAFSDQFACGSVLWETLVGQKLFDGATDFDIYTKLREGQVRPLRPLRPDVPKSLVSVVQRALSPHERARFPSVREMARHLSAVLKAAGARRDLHALMGSAVAETRANLDMGSRVGEASAITPVADVTAGAEVVVDASAAEGPPKERTWGLRHVLPFFRGRK